MIDNNKNYKQIKHLETEYNECTIRGICSISPTLYAVKSVVQASLLEFGYYLNNLMELGIRNVELEGIFLDCFSLLVTNIEYKDDELCAYLLFIQEIIKQVKQTYQKYCNDNGLKIKYFKSLIKTNPQFQINDFIKQGIKFSDKIKRQYTEEQIKGYDISLFVLKSVYLYVLELKSLDADYSEFFKNLLSRFLKEYFAKKNFELTKQEIYNDIDVNTSIVEYVHNARKQSYGELIENDILVSPKIGKCILVTGNNLHELQLLLEAVKGTEINVYTHGYMIDAFTYSKFKEYPNLVGHWGEGADFYSTDFNAFPGPIFITKMCLYKVENLYFSRIYTTNVVAPKNTITIKDYNFEPLIKAALSADGFEETKPEKIMRFGIDEPKYFEKIEELKTKILSKNIKNVFIIGVSNKTKAQIEYFKTFMNLLKDDSYAITFYYKSENKNTLYTRINYLYPFFSKILNELTPLKEQTSFKIHTLVTRCEFHTIASLIYLTRQNVDSVYFHQCSPLLINPAQVDLLLEMFNIKRFTNPITDYAIMTSD